MHGVNDERTFTALGYISRMSAADKFIGGRLV